MLLYEKKINLRRLYKKLSIKINKIDILFLLKISHQMFFFKLHIIFIYNYSKNNC